jgi:hypothetical protein
VQTSDADALPSNTTEEDLVALKAEYLAAHSTYQTYVALCATAELGNAQSWDKLVIELEQALDRLERARGAYRRALFEIAFGGDVSPN